MATVKVYAKPEHVLAYPGENLVGHLRRYIGRKTKITRDDKGVVTEIAHRALNQAVEIDLDSQDGRRIARLFVVDAENPPLWPADKESAALLNTKFVPVSYDEAAGEWLAQAETPKPKAEKASGGDK